MKLCDIPSSMLAQAIDIYLRLAYPDAPPPPRVRDLAQVDPEAPLADALDRPCVQKALAPGIPGLVEKYLWRLGNARFGHMKLALGRCSEADDFVFLVDTHDRDLPEDSSVYHEPDYAQLVQRNARLKQAIEAEWDQAGIPTMRGDLTRYLLQRRAHAEAAAKTVLIVDDDEGVRDLEQAVVEQAGYRVVTAADALDAIATLERLGCVDLCLLDIMMPRLNGHAAARRFRTLATRRFPIIYVTALPRDRAHDDVADDYVAKPFSADHLLDVIRHHLE